jgi:ribosomal protein S17
LNNFSKYLEKKAIIKHSVNKDLSKLYKLFQRVKKVVAEHHEQINARVTDIIKRTDELESYKKMILTLSDVSLTLQVYLRKLN